MIFVGFFFVSLYQKNSKVYLSVFYKLSVVETSFWIRGVGKVTRFSVRNVLCHSAEKNCTAILQCFTDSCIEKFFAL